jgi:hypothetical protein
MKIEQTHHVDVGEHLRTLGKPELNWLSGRGNGYEPVRM